MKSKFLISILSFASLNAVIPVNSHQEVAVQAPNKKQQINRMFNEIAEIASNAKNLNFDKEAQDLYSKYRTYDNFMDLLNIFRYICNSSMDKYRISKETYPLSFLVDDLKEYLSQVETIEYCDFAWTHEECAIKLYTIYSKTPEFSKMIQLFGKIDEIDRQALSEKLVELDNKVLRAAVETSLKLIMGLAACMYINEL